MAMSANAAIKPTPIPQQSRRDDEGAPEGAPSLAIACCELAFNDSGALTARATVTEAAPARPEDERSDKADYPDDYEDDPRNLNVDTCDLSVHCPGQDRTNRD